MKGVTFASWVLLGALVLFAAVVTVDAVVGATCLAHSDCGPAEVCFMRSRTDIPSTCEPLATEGEDCIPGGRDTQPLYVATRPCAGGFQCIPFAVGMKCQ